MLNPQQIKARGGKLTASRVGALMSGDPAKVLALWEIMTGQREEEDLSGVWAVQLGTVTEALNLAWYERTQGAQLSRHGDVICCPSAPWAAATLDAFDAGLIGPVEAKHVGGFEPREKVIARYMPQLHWQMRVTESGLSALTIIEGAKEPAIEIVPYDATYGDELWSRAEAFMECVNSLTPPCALPAVAAPAASEKLRTVDMSGSNSWASFAADWLSTRTASQIFTKAEKELKALMEPDVGRAFAHGIECKRAKNGSLRISEMKEKAA